MVVCACVCVCELSELSERVVGVNVRVCEEMSEWVYFMRLKWQGVVCVSVSVWVFANGQCFDTQHT